MMLKISFVLRLQCGVSVHTEELNIASLSTKRRDHRNSSESNQSPHEPLDLLASLSQTRPSIRTSRTRSLQLRQSSLRTTSLWHRMLEGAYKQIRIPIRKASVLIVSEVRNQSREQER